MKDSRRLTESFYYRLDNLLCKADFRYKVDYAFFFVKDFLRATESGSTVLRILEFSERFLCG